MWEFIALPFFALFQFINVKLVEALHYRFLMLNCLSFHWGVTYFMLYPVFPLSCVRVRAHTSREMSAHEKSAYKCSFQKCFVHISYMSFQIQTSPGKELHIRNFMRTQTGTLVIIFHCQIYCLSYSK